LAFFKQAYAHFSASAFPNNIAKDLRNAYSRSEQDADAVLRKMESRGHSLPAGGRELYAHADDHVKEALYFDALEMSELFIDVKPSASPGGGAPFERGAATEDASRAEGLPADPTGEEENEHA
jgi:hypothetical protein